MSALSYGSPKRWFIPSAYSRPKAPNQLGAAGSEGAKGWPNPRHKSTGGQYGGTGTAEYGEDREAWIQNHEDTRSIDPTTWPLISTSVS